MLIVHFIYQNMMANQEGTWEPSVKIFRSHKDTSFRHSSTINDGWRNSTPLNNIKIKKKMSNCHMFTNIATKLLFLLPSRMRQWPCMATCFRVVQKIVYTNIIANIFIGETSFPLRLRLRDHLEIVKSCVSYILRPGLINLRFILRCCYQSLI